MTNRLVVELCSQKTRNGSLARTPTPNSVSPPVKTSPPSGVGEKKLVSYGDEIVAIINEMM